MAPVNQTTNQPEFDPLNPTPEEDADMLAGYLDGFRKLPFSRDTVAYAWGRGSALRDHGDEPDAQRQEVERRMHEMMRLRRKSA